MHRYIILANRRVSVTVCMDASNPGYPDASIPTHTGPLHQPVILVVMCLSTYLLYCFFSLFFNAEDGGNMFLWNIGKRLPDYMASQRRRCNSLLYICTPIPNSFNCSDDETIDANIQPCSCELILHILFPSPPKKKKQKCLRLSHETCRNKLIRSSSFTDVTDIFNT
jgi:hypothetical protein